MNQQTSLLGNRRTATELSFFARRIYVLAFGTLIGLLLSNACSAEDDESHFNVRKEDEIVLSSGEKLRGKLTDEEGGKYKFDNGRITRYIAKDEISAWRKKATKEEELNRLAKKYATDPVNLLRIAKEATTRFNMNKEVIPILEKFTSARADEGALQMLGTLYLNAGQAEKALEIGNKLASAGRTHPKFLRLRGEALAALDKLEDAEKDLVSAYKSAPQDEDVVFAYANLLMREGRTDDAKKIFTDIIATNPRNASAHSGLGFVLIRIGNFSAAEQSFQQALDINHDDRSALIGMGTSMLMNKRFDDAFDVCTRILNIDTNCAEAYAIQAFAMIYKGDPASLQRVDDKNYIKFALDAKPDQPQLRLKLAWAAMLDRQARFEDLKSEKEKKESGASAVQKRQAAKQLIDEILTSDTPDSYIQYFIGERRFREAEDARRRKDDAAMETALEKAESAYRKAAKLSPTYAPVNGALGSTLLRRKKYDEAKVAFESAAKSDSTSAAAADYFAGQGLALLKNDQKFEEAKKFFKQALELDPANAPAHCGRGYIANYQHEKDLAIEGFQKALASDGDCAYAAHALQQIYKQDDREMEYVRFSGSEWPTGWKPTSPEMIKFTLSNGQAVVVGNPGQQQYSRMDLYRNFPGAGKFERLEADLTLLPSSTSAFGLRISNAAGASNAFEVQFGKDESDELKVWIRDGSNANGEWKPTNGTKWPASGHVRLGIETDGFVGQESKVRLFANGALIAKVTLSFQFPPKSLTLGVFLTPSPKDSINAAINNIAIVKKGSAEAARDNPSENKIEPVKPEEKGK